MSDPEKLKIKTKAVQRSLKELEQYVKDETKQLAKVQELQARLKQQEAVLAETSAMIPIAKKNLSDYSTQLQEALGKAEENAATIQLVTDGSTLIRQITTAYPEVLKPDSSATA